MLPALNTAFTLSYTLAMSGKALVASALHGTDGVREVAYEWASGLCRACDVRVRTEGLERLDLSRPLVIASNHQSHADVPCIMMAMGRSFGFLTKKELFRVPVFGPAMLRLGCVSIDRKDPERARVSIAHAAERVRAGASIVVFPEGTRGSGGQLGPFKKGAFHLVQEAKVPMVPIAVLGTSRIMSKTGMLAYGGDVVVRIGAPIVCEDGTTEAREALISKVREAMLGLIGQGE